VVLLSEAEGGSVIRPQEPVSYISTTLKQGESFMIDDKILVIVNRVKGKQANLIVAIPKEALMRRFSTEGVEKPKKGKKETVQDGT
jgi:sRNA-binding carbon storage regulator CsrA